MGLACLFTDDAHGVTGIIAANVEEVFYFVGLQHLEDFVAIGCVGFVAGGAQCAGRRVGHHLQVVAGLLCQVHKVLVDDASHPVACAIHMRNVVEAPRLQRHTHQGLVDDGGGAAALCDQNFSRCHGAGVLVVRQKLS